MIYCSNCGKAVPDGSNFCTFCGAAIAVIDPQKPTVTTPATASPEPRQAVATNTMMGKNAFYTNVGFWGALILLAGSSAFLFFTVKANKHTSVAISGKTSMRRT